jgi:quercetin 2,3-dioxygenase
MIELRPFGKLGGENHGWLDAKHHFSFAGYYDPDRMGWGRLRVWNDDTIAPKSGFPPHPHAEMEIITYVRDGAITHEDSLGNKGRTTAGDVQVMSAGTGIQHAEYNLEPVTTRIFQIWILPDRRGGAPSWGTRPFPKRNGPASSSPWRAASTTMATRCRSGLPRACWARRSRPGKA